MWRNLQSIFTVLVFCLGLRNCELQRHNRKLEDARTINVPSSSFSNIQAAIDSVPSNNSNWIIIDIKAGIYKEQVKISADRPLIHLKGEVGKTSIVWNASGSIFDSATFDSLAPNILVTGITFVNSYNYPLSNGGNPAKPAVAAKISGDKSALYDCSFLGYQDTLYDYDGRHYFKNCNITGAVDFIFGNGQSIYEECTISVDRGVQDNNFVGYITAQGRENPNVGSGFVFNNCNVIGNAKMYLGRAWRPYARVIFYNSFLSDIIVSQGWDSWYNGGDEAKLTFAEEQCRGLGSDKSSRVKWEKSLSQEELQSFTSISYIDKEGWMSKLPSHSH
ncbi:probable pectinesterase 29 [Salvia miltiorrhiza]|uniref:probable pectinesterase 29 n=1 Tax=Salvia miltiorrhiza TaxID=226208 RepID=UPI0025AD27B0|nr:probable pectinesterase 29 [Salvia miltiorrhiza]